MAAVGRLVRTTVFKISLVYLVVFAGLTVFLLAYVSSNTSSLLDGQINAAIESEIGSLAEQYQRGGIRQLVATVDLRSRRPGASLYLLADVSGRTVVGNVSDLPLAVLAQPDGTSLTVTYQRLDGDVRREYDALVRVYTLPGGFKLLVGRDVGELADLRSVIFGAARVAIVAMVLLGLLTSLLVGRWVMRRVENIAATSRRIMAGDLSHRLAVTGSGDEFDDLALSLNEMLARIEALMTGLKEVSDNIAHDLKTPLARLRSRLETTLRADGGADPREAIGASIEEADRLIHVFDALLKIARMDAGASGDTMEPLDAAGILSEIAELYEPVVEEAGGRLRLDIGGPLPIRGNRTLISQALGNLIDNAIKYAVRDDGTPLEVAVAGRRDGGRIRLSVSDNGPGIAEDERPRVTERFVRLDSSRSRDGSGIGLSMVAAVARSHHGSVAFADAAPGLCATIDLPAELRP